MSIQIITPAANLNKIQSLSIRYNYLIQPHCIAFIYFMYTVCIFSHRKYTTTIHRVYIEYTSTQFKTTLKLV